MKRLVVCCDGTWNRLEAEHQTNVVKTARAVNLDDTDPKQIVFYDEGVGTGEGQISKLDEYIGGATGRGLFKNVEDAYRFLSLNYVPGDEIFVFGFSRGAFTARTLCGLIGQMGIPVRSDVDATVDAQLLYREGKTKKSDAKWQADRDELFNKASFHEPHEDMITFLGVWHTVESRGIPETIFGLELGAAKFYNKKFDFHDVKLSNRIKSARHAVSIDEQRNVFDITLMNDAEDNHSDVKQIWFAGAHSDIGGGNDTAELSDIALISMLEEAQEKGLVLYPDWQNLIGGVAPNPAADVDLSFPKPGQKKYAVFGFSDRLPRVADGGDTNIFDKLFDWISDDDDEKPVARDGELGNYYLTADKIHRSVAIRWAKRNDYRPGSLMQREGLEAILDTFAAAGGGDNPEIPWPSVEA